MASSPEESPVLAAVRAAVAPRPDVPGSAACPTTARVHAPGRWWVALSGGVDSTVLLDAAARVLGPGAAGRLAAVHVNHGLHPDARAWEDHCREAAARYAIALVVRRVEVGAAAGGGGIEAAARAARLDAFADAVPSGDSLLLAHHRDDQAETALLRILRGAGPAGMAAMRPEVIVRGLRLVRPLLAVPRTGVLSYARERGLDWIEDPANLDPAHDRNHLRHRVLPALAERWPDAGAVLARLAARAGETASMLDALAEADLAAAPGTARGTLSVAAIAALPPHRAANALRAWLVARHRIAPPPRRWLGVVVAEVAGAGPDRRPEAARGGIWVRRYRKDLHTGRDRAPPRLPASTPWRLDAGPLDLPHGRLAAVRVEGEGLAAVRLPPVVEVRFRYGGERCRPHPRAVTKPLKDLFQELGIPPWERGEQPLVYAGGRLAAAPGLFLCDPFAAGAGAGAGAGERAWCLEWTPRDPA